MGGGKSHVQNIKRREDRSYPTIAYIQPAVERGENCYYMGFDVITQALILNCLELAIGCVKLEWSVFNIWMDL